jgi:hypothetical protein
VVVINKTELLTDNEVVEIKNNSNHWMWFSKWYLPNKTLVSNWKTNYCLLSIPVLYAIMRQSSNTRHYDSLKSVRRSN